MAKRWFLVGCGVAQEQYDAVVADLGRAQQELQSVKAELDQAKAELDKTMTELDKTKAEMALVTAAPDKTEVDVTKVKAELATAKNDLEKTNTELATVRAELEKARGRIDAVSSAWSSLKPKVEILSIIVESMETTAIKGLTVQGAFSITEQEYRRRTADQRERIAMALEAVGNNKLTEALLGKDAPDLTEHLAGAWDTGAFGSRFTIMGAESVLRIHYELWRKAVRILIDLTNPDMESLSKQVSP